MATRKNKTVAQSKKDALWHVAVREAGRAVAAHAVGVPLGDVTIISGVTADGSRYTGHTTLGHDPHQVRRAIDDNYDVDDRDLPGMREETFLTSATSHAHPNSTSGRHQRAQPKKVLHHG